MKNHVLRVASVLVLLAFTLTSLPSYAMYGARPMGMGGAFTAIADDANAAYWNPAGFAINPGVDVYGSLLANNRNESIGDNMAALKMCFETDLNPFAWAIGIGAVSLLALEGAKYLSDRGLLKKNWGRKDDVEKVSKDESVADKVLEKGEEKTAAAGQKIKEKAGQAVSGAAKEVRVEARPVYWGPWSYPYYRHNFHRPTYWDNREAQTEYSPQGKAQFAAGFTFVTDKNSILRQDTNFYTFSLATGYEERVALGGNVNLYDLGVKTSSGSTIKGYGTGIDLGLLIRPVDELTFGAVVKEILTSDIYFENGAVLAYKMSVNAGISITPIEVLTLSADIHNIFRQSADPQTYHYGAEFRPFPGLALRGGLNDGSKTAGASFMIGSLVIDYAYLGGSFNRTQMIGLTWKL